MFKFVLIESEEPLYRGKEVEHSQNMTIGKEPMYDKDDYRCACYKKMPSTRITDVVGNEKEAVAQYRKAVRDFAERKGVGFVALQIEETDHLYPNVNSDRVVVLNYVWCDSPGPSEFYEKAVEKARKFDLRYTLYTCCGEVSPGWPGEEKWQTFLTAEEAMAAYIQSESQYEQKALTLVMLCLSEGSKILRSGRMTSSKGNGNVTLYQLRRVKRNKYHSVSREDWASCPMSVYREWDRYVEGGENLPPGSDHCIVFSPESDYYVSPEQRRRYFDGDDISIG